ncbi:MAG TPA: NADH-quinone oxidoreductase subunit N [Methylococcus sp.]|nr:NADH-quinone oxidoreductase subunit N [Methylococcus sp.]
MTVPAVIALLPWIVLTGAVVVLMLAIAIRRSFPVAFWGTVVSLLGTLASLAWIRSDLPIAATSLLRIDAYTWFFGILLSGSALAVACLCFAYFRKRENENEEIFLLLLTATLGGMTLVASNHFAMFFLGIEILTISLFPMIAYSVRASLPLEAGIKYLVLSGLASAFLLFGMALVYGELGLLSFEQIGRLGLGLESRPLVLTGVLLILAAVGFKLSWVPFHLWTPDVYQGAPAPVTAFVATVSKSAVFALWLRFLVDVQADRSEILACLLGVLALASVLAGNLLALFQQDLKRILAYSSIAHMGYLLVALVAAGRLGHQLLSETVGFYLAAYTITSIAAFGVVSALSDDTREDANVDDYQGLFWRSPGLATTLTVALLSLAGIPLTVGFLGKFYVFAVAVEAETWVLLGAVLVGSGIGLYYYLRVVWIMLQPTEKPVPSPPLHPAAGSMLALLTGLILALGVFPQKLIEAATNELRPESVTHNDAELATVMRRLTDMAASMVSEVGPRSALPAPLQPARFSPDR